MRCQSADEALAFVEGASHMVQPVQAGPKEPRPVRRHHQDSL